MAKRFGFGRKEKLKSRKEIEELFATGKSFPVFPLRIIFRFLPSGTGGSLKIGVSASKRYFKKAVDRNRIKRLLREAYRLQKQDLAGAVQEQNIEGFVFFMYTGKTIATFQEIMEAMKKSLDQLQKNLKKNENHS